MTLMDWIVKLFGHRTKPIKHSNEDKPKRRRKR
jgi:hypothetical protein